MSPRIKKLIGTIIILLWLPIYAFFIAGVAAHLLPHASWWAAFLFYALAGTLWAVPVGAMFPWMMREPMGKA
ncbi:MAG: DUF2842 domain-containing protein [Alphaproteobacteria bacterium]|nr:DUF2842 domain-containing protein [Alphaproteobacteria bacterium]MBV9905115.1 DUF2842 domain-containing protein [Alphaproteobacteria bacterium]